MTSRRQVSRAGLELIKRFEGYRGRAARLPDGRWTIGYGHTKTARPGAEVSLDDAEALLIYDLLPVTQAVREHSHAPLGQNQFDALCAFAFNIGLEAFRGSDVLRHLNAGEPLQAAGAMDLWRKADLDGDAVVIDALVRRRAVEKALFLTPEEGFHPSPSPLLRPRLDEDHTAGAPPQEPAVVVAAMDGDRLVAERVPADAQPALDLAPFPYEAPPEPPAPAPAPADDAPPIPAREALAADAAFDAAALSPVPDAGIDAPALEELRAVLSPTLLWAGLALFGLVVFAAGIFWGFSPDTAEDGGAAPVVIGWGLGLIGILCVATSVYFLLDRLGGEDGEE